jgi:beta-phosphoglucomutase-like phosphatase (HAD superfamily)
MIESSDLGDGGESDLGPAIEIVREAYPRGGFRAALFDFDGTLSLLRRGWQDVMIPMMVEILAQTPRAESRDDILRVVDDYVARLTGKQTIYQMIQLAEEVERRGGAPLEPLAYKRTYHDRLWAEVERRIAAVRSDEIAAEEMMVPGSIALLDRLRERGLPLYLASGTDLSYVRDEVAVLGLSAYFEPHVYGALDDYRSFSKAMIVDRIVSEEKIEGRALIGFGDGYVEIQEIKRVGGLAVGVASNEIERRGINEWKRRRLIEAGADVIVADYRHVDELLNVVGLS